MSYARDANAREVNVAKMLDSMIATTDDDQILTQLHKQKSETEAPEERLAPAA